MLLLPAADLVDVGVGGEGTERAEIGREHTLVRLFHNRENLIHEQDGSFEQDFRVRLGALLRQIERIADRVGDVLDVRRRIVVRQNVSVFFFLETGDFCLKASDALPSAHSSARLPAATVEFREANQDRSDRSNRLPRARGKYHRTSVRSW